MKELSTITNLIRNSMGFLEIEDPFSQERMKAFFCLDDFYESQNDSIFNYLMSYRDECPMNVLICLKLLGDYIFKFTEISNYAIAYNSVSFYD